MTLTLLPPHLPLSLPWSLHHLLFPLFSGCSKCLETAVGARTGPGGRPHQGTVGHGSRQNRTPRSLGAGSLTCRAEHVLVTRSQMLLFGLVQSEPSVLQVGPASTPSPGHVHTSKIFPLNIVSPRRKSNSRRMYLHAPHSPSALHTLHDGYRHRRHLKPKKKRAFPTQFSLRCLLSEKGEEGKRKDDGRD